MKRRLLLVTLIVLAALFGGAWHWHAPVAKASPSVEDTALIVQVTPVGAGATPINVMVIETDIESFSDVPVLVKVHFYGDDEQGAFKAIAQLPPQAMLFSFWPFAMNDSANGNGNSEFRMASVDSWSW